MTRPRVLFVNGGILGLLTFQQFLDSYLPRQSILDAERIVLTENLTLAERGVRRLLTQRFWKDGLFGLRNMDLARLRYEMHAGLLARRRMRGRRFDAIHFHRQATAYSSLDLMRRVPSIVSVDCTQECVMQMARGRIERISYRPNVWLDGAVFRRAKAVVATSHWAAASIRAWYPDCVTAIHVLPNPVLLESFDVSWIERRRERTASGGKVRVLFMGGDFHRKGGSVLLDAWEAGRFEARAELTIATAGGVGRPLPPGVSVRNDIVQHSAAWRSLWADADLFVLPTRNEAFGVVFQEAGAAGLPAIGTRHNAVPEIIKDGETGLLVPVDDGEALAAAMSALIGDPALRARFGERARLHIEQTADPSRYLRALVALISSVLHS